MTGKSVSMEFLFYIPVYLLRNKLRTENYNIIYRTLKKCQTKLPQPPFTSVCQK